jgi:hypothetical protein
MPITVDPICWCLELRYNSEYSSTDSLTGGRGCRIYGSRITLQYAQHVTLIICNSTMRTAYFPVQWKVTQIIMIPKSGRPLEEASSGRRMSLLPVMSKIFDKVILKILRQILEETRILTDHQFGFRQEHSTTGKVRRSTGIIIATLGKTKQYCSAAFLGIT